MSRKISQETFDDVVRENVEDFDLDEKAALEDAINQFNKQGVDLSNIDISGGIGRQEILDAIKDLDLSRKGTNGEILSALSKITALCCKDHEYQLRNRMFVLNQGGVNNLHILFDVARSIEVLVQSMTLLEDLSKNNGNRFILWVLSMLSLILYLFDLSQLKSETFSNLVAPNVLIMS